MTKTDKKKVISWLNAHVRSYQNHRVKLHKDVYLWEADHLAPDGVQIEEKTGHLIADGLDLQIDTTYYDGARDELSFTYKNVRFYWLEACI